LKPGGERSKQVDAIHKDDLDPPSACINKNIDASYFHIAEKRGITPSQLENILKGETTGHEFGRDGEFFVCPGNGNQREPGLSKLKRRPR